MLEVTSKQGRAIRAFLDEVKELPLQNRISQAVANHGSFEGDFEFLNELSMDDIITVIVTQDFKVVYNKFEQHEIILSSLYLGGDPIVQKFASYIVGLRNANKFFGGSYDHPILDEKYIFTNEQGEVYDFPEQFIEEGKEYEYIHMFPNRINELDEFLIERGL
ncbi:hypothetical protein Bolokhovo_71 [Bacillus phage Bolokhovo]|uniref:Uncharacterized protein n=1 Tax=Bacillus phage Bolokhovo TaxID=2743970 RepID=A0A7D7PV52_9CAUD|nr:hypothetical protein Bolokhovo_71 [Bacillus phage Bolokhovo]